MNAGPQVVPAQQLQAYDGTAFDAGATTSIAIRVTTHPASHPNCWLRLTCGVACAGGLPYRRWKMIWSTCLEAAAWGLGLAIVAEIAQRHGDEARVLAAQPHRLRVQLWIPA